MEDSKKDIKSHSQEDKGKDESSAALQGAETAKTGKNKRNRNKNKNKDKGQEV